MILYQNITMTTWAFSFTQKGIYVFENYSSKKLTVVSVVGSDQTCSNSVNGGVGASMITQQALSEIGIESQKKNVDPDWNFIGLSYFMIFLFIFVAIGIIVLG